MRYNKIFWAQSLKNKQIFRFTQTKPVYMIHHMNQHVLTKAFRISIRSLSNKLLLKSKSNGAVDMQSISNTPILEFNPNTLEDVRTELNLQQEGVLNQMIDSFEDWISKQNHFTKRNFDRHYLETSIILCKGSLERAKKTLDKLCTLKTLLPQFFSKQDAKELADISEFMIQATMPKLLKNNYRLYVVKMVSTDFDQSKLFDFHRFAILMSEYVKRHDYCQGFTCLVDCRDVNLMNMITKINILDLRDCMSVLIEGYGMRIKGIHIISTSKAVDMLVSLLKQVISDKVADRINVHKTEETLYEYIPKEFLPKEFGGDEKSVKTIYGVFSYGNDYALVHVAGQVDRHHMSLRNLRRTLRHAENWVKELSTKENVQFFKDICNTGTNEKYRLTANYNDQILGMPGSFRTLTVD